MASKQRKKTMRAILVPTDFSENSQKALEFAQEIAERYDAGISLVHAYHPPMVDSNLPAEALVELAEQIEQLNAKTMKKWETECREDGFACKSKLVYGAASEVILEEIQAQKPILVVMGRTGKGGWLDKLIGSVASAVVAEAACPVLVLPPQTQTKTIKKIVYATELERPEENALGFAFNLAEHFKADLELVKVNAPFEVDVFEDEQFRDDIKKSFGNKKYTLQTIEAESVVGGLQKYADENKADLIVMATRKRDWLSGLINPSVSKKMVLAVEIPILVCHLEQLERMEA
ncbi:universal stress protein [Runella sp.]|uniref:universal stress protein n=1 Tax=Runella sp. TaxID=1960881 RepID=UPI00301734EA